MVDPRIVQIATEEAERKRKQREEAVERQDRISKFDAFDREWKAVYPTEGDMTPEIAIEIAAAYMCLADGIRERLWDFHIADLLRENDNRNRYVEVVLRILGYACSGDAVEVHGCLVTSAGFIANVVREHHDLYDRLLVVSGAGGMPFTPPLNSTEMRHLLGITYEAFRWAKSQGLWKPHPDDPARKHRHRWRHDDPKAQKAALEKIREKYAKKIWGALR